ncbi:hypothetical protein LTR84_003676 [Exophiala bonariae]|uniref:Uncharacterized protein n=1 Tax=Exophiala bonariae TaxID=1690606 RepID=A0AAV9N5Y0_9EURO|nr:hypothetical protein LTR84_003676 [Exophiala bonariae]
MFIEYAAKGRSTRDQELINSDIRAHAARWAYQKSLSQRREDQETSPGSQKAVLKRDESSINPTRTGPRPLLPRPFPRGRATVRKGRVKASDQTLVPRDQASITQIILPRVNSPIQSYPVPLDGDKFRAIEYFPQLWSRWAADVIPNTQDRQVATDKAVATIVQRCLTDELHMSAFISYVLQRAPAAKPSKVFLLRMAGKALSELRSRIESGHASLEEVVWPIIFLAHYELFGSESVVAGRAHLKAVVDLGGMEYLDEVTKVYIRRMDRGWWSDHPSIFPPSPAPRPQWDKLVPETSQNDSIGAGFNNHAEVLGPELVEILPFIVDCVRAGVLCNELMLFDSEDEILQNKVIRRCQGLMDALREQLPTGPEKMACIYPAMIWLQYTTWVMRDLATKATSSVNAYRKITNHAHPTLLRCIGQGTQAQEMLLWAAAVGIATSSDEAVRIQYASHALRLAANLDLVELMSSWRSYIWFEVCAIVDYALILDALDKAMEQDSSLESQDWETSRRSMMHRFDIDNSNEGNPLP